MAKKEGKAISPAELQILNVLWKSAPLTASDIVQSLAEEKEWHSRTIKTLITRLVKKKYVGFKQEKNHYLYFPLIDQNEYQQSMSHSFIYRVFGGKISPLVAYFAKQEKISKEDIKELKAILEELDSHD